MNIHSRDRYYDSGLGAEDNRSEFNRYRRADNFEREYQDEYRGRQNNHPYKANDDYKYRDYNMERDYHNKVRRDSHELDNIRQGYGYPAFRNESTYQNDIEQMERERNAQYQQGYGSGRLSGYSGSRFGGSNYSAHGDFGSGPDYGSMSGKGGNTERYVSSSGYGGGNSLDSRGFENDRYHKYATSHRNYDDAPRADEYDRRDNTRYHQRW
jgi:hypothetical protein